MSNIDLEYMKEHGLVEVTPEEIMNGIYEEKADRHNRKLDFSKEQLLAGLLSNAGMSNGSAIGYAIIAMRELQFGNSTIEKVARRMYEVMDFISDEQAEKIYQNGKGVLWQQEKED